MRDSIQTTQQGINYLLRGLRRLPDADIRSFVIMPILINILVFGLVIWLAIEQFSDLMTKLMAWLPEWLNFLSFLIWPLFAITLLVGTFFTFTLLANLIAAPFNGFLAERIQQELDPGCVPDTGWQGLVRLIPRTFVRELQRLGYYLPRVLGLLLLSFIPVINLITPLLWVLFSAWMLGIQYCDYAADNELVNFRDMKTHLARPWSQTAMFGGLVSLLTLVPLVNLVIMPAAVIGGTHLWVERRMGRIESNTSGR